VRWCNVGVLSVSLGSVLVRIIPIILVLRAVRVVVSVPGRCASRCNLGALTFLNVQSYKRVGNRDLKDGIGDWIGLD